MADVAESIELATLDKEMAEEKVCNSFGDRCFAAVGPRLWNTLPVSSTAVRQSRAV